MTTPWVWQGACRLFRDAMWKKEEDSCRSHGRVRWTNGLPCSEFSQCLYILALQWISFFHKLGLNLCIRAIVYYANYQRYEIHIIKTSLNICGIGLGASFKASGDTNDHIYHLCSFRKGQVSVY